MSTSGILEIAIGLAFVYILAALLCSAITETVSSLFDRRAKYLQDAVKRLLSPVPAPGAANTKSDDDIASKVLGHGLIKGLLTTKSSSGPSYIPARTFALAVFETLAPNTPTSRFNAIRTRVERLPDGTLRQSLLASDVMGDFVTIDLDFGCPIDYDLSDIGDSGALWVHRETAAPVALHRAGSNSGRERAFAVRFDAVLQALQLRML